MRKLIVCGLFGLAVVCAFLAWYGFDQTVNPPRCGSEEVIFSCHGDLWYHLISGIVFVVVGLAAIVGGVALALRLRVVGRSSDH